MGVGCSPDPEKPCVWTVVGFDVGERKILPARMAMMSSTTVPIATNGNGRGRIRMACALSCHVALPLRSVFLMPGMSYCLNLGPWRFLMRWGHQWKRVVERISSGRRCSSAQRANWSSSSSSIVAKWRLTRQLLVSGHRCSAGCSSGAYGGRKRKWRCSGTRSLTLVGFQPARSSTSTGCLVGLAPAWRAKAASSTSKTGILTVVGRWARGKQVRPEAGCTKPTKERQAKRCCTGATGRWPIGAPIRRSNDFYPLRCSSVARFPTTRSARVGRRWRPLLGGDGSFFKTRLLLGIRERRARTGDLQAVLGAHEVAPAQMMGDRVAQAGADPGGGLPAGPVFVACRRRGYGLAQLLLQRGRPRGRGPMRRRVPGIVHAGRPFRVVAFCELPDPVGRITGNGRDLHGGVPFGGQA